MADVIVIGKGIVGSTVATYLKNLGVSVLLLDNSSPLAGTPASGGHLKPSWFSSLYREDYEPALRILDACWGLEESRFKIWPGLTSTTVYRVDTDIVVKTAFKEADVEKVVCPDNPRVCLSTGEEIQAKWVVVAAGVCTSELVKDFLPLKIVSKQGISFRVSGTLLEPFIKPWSPYKQIVAHQQRNNEVWIGDGTAILQKNWNIGIVNKCKKRCLGELAPGTTVLRQITGLRPYCSEANKICFFKKIGNVFVVTGTGKNGTIAAGYAAREVANAIS